MTGAEDTIAEAPVEEGAAHGAALLQDWPHRPWVLGLLLALFGLLADTLIGDYAADAEPWRSAGVAFLVASGLATAFTLSLERVRESLLFAAVIGLVLAGITYNVTASQDSVAGVEYAFAAAVFFALLALPLFQAGFHRTRLATDYRATHFHVWADAVSGGGAIAFTVLSWLLLFLLDLLFEIVGIDLIGELMEQGWFAWSFSGAAFGAGLGVIRNNLKIIGALQGVVMLVFALLAVPLALALMLFLVMLVASGGAALWDGDLSATPVLLTCAAGSFVLFNAIIRDDDEARSRNPVMLAAGMVLAALILPLVVFAAIGMGLRIDQHGLSPERIWGVIAVAVASAYGLAAWVALARGRMAGWSEGLRQANLRLAAGVCVLALVLALPLADFGAVSARNQVARLEAGEVSPQDFDYTALRWDFGDAGRAALADLAAGDGEVARLAGLAQQQEFEQYRGMEEELAQTGFTGELRVQSDDAALEPLVRDYLEANPWQCGDFCVALELRRTDDGRREVALVQSYRYERVLVGENNAEVVAVPPQEAPAAQVQELTRDSTVELREETVRYIYVDGVRMGDPVD